MNLAELKKIKMSKDPAKRAVYEAAMNDENTKKIMEIQQVKETTMFNIKRFQTGMRRARTK